MFRQIRKYRNFLAVAFLSFYLAGGLQFPVLECLHFISHIDEMVQGKYAEHHFHSHSNDHQHIALTTFDAQTNHDNESVPVNETTDKSSKKSPQLFHLNHPESFCFFEKAAPNYRPVRSSDGLLPAVPSPPPRA